MPFISIAQDVVEKFGVRKLINANTSIEFRAKDFGNKLTLLFIWRR